ncbi:arginine deiminase [Peptoniphilus indolicus]|uniref:Arginine deiminase n=2 Tax=Peptoniphilus indolicus TaxID=33030 RepID=G4D6U2_9FIRM|nr:arginine deiminase [Peptoniphilus indolicus]EGY76381.1 arginine deiminase [Peptoniphilus indolicus ATCC 29427]SUB76226.1 Arginine deiminase [Peptoniphilus indolicus]
MSREKAIHVYSEIGKLKTVLLHRPGKEIENLTPDLLDRLLFDDIPFLEVAVQEHDAFANILRENGVEVLYLEELVAEAITSEEIKNEFVDEFISEANIEGKTKKKLVKDLLMSFESNFEMVLKMMEGIKKDELPDFKKLGLTDMVDSEYPFIVDSMPNLYFTRDPAANIGYGVSLNKMRNLTRQRETIFAKYILKYHPRFKDADLELWYDRTDSTAIEGGDELVLSKEVLAVGISERTDAASIEKLAERIFEKNESFKKILALYIPNKRAFMHLDTVFTMVDYDKFTIHPEIEGPLSVYSLTKGEDGRINIEKENKELDKVLAEALGLESVTLIRCGGDDPIAGAREQWNDGANTLAIAPGEVVVYSRNKVTNKLLEEYGIKLHIMPSSELSRGRGGPRCMSMPLWREDI